MAENNMTGDFPLTSNDYIWNSTSSTTAGPATMIIPTFGNTIHVAAAAPSTPQKSDDGEATRDLATRIKEILSQD